MYLIFSVRVIYVTYEPVTEKNQRSPRPRDLSRPIMSIWFIYTDQLVNNKEYSWTQLYAQQTDNNDMMHHDNLHFQSITDTKQSVYIYLNINRSYNFKFLTLYLFYAYREKTVQRYQLLSLKNSPKAPNSKLSCYLVVSV